MRSRGQSSLDLLFALVVMLVVLASLNGVVSSFSASQKEIALHQQLRENGFVSGVFLAGLTHSYHGSFSYPVKPSTFSSLSTVVDGFVRGTGSMPLSSVRIAGYPQGVSCSFSVDWSGKVVNLVSTPADSGLTKTVSYQQGFASVTGFDSKHVLSSDGCGSFVRVEGS